MSDTPVSADYSQEEFENNAQVRRDNIANIEKQNEQLNVMLNDVNFKIKESEFIISAGEEGQAILKPTFAYETRPEYLAIQLERQQFVLDEIKQKKQVCVDMINTNNKSIAKEKMRLKLIEEGIPAWNDNVFEAHGTEDSE